MIIEKAPRDTLKDTLDAINRFVCFYHYSITEPASSFCAFAFS